MCLGWEGKKNRLLSNESKLKIYNSEKCMNLYEQYDVTDKTEYRK